MQYTPYLVHCVENLHFGMVLFKLIQDFNKERAILNSVNFSIITQ